jgi:hypothetical protein
VARNVDKVEVSIADAHRGKTYVDSYASPFLLRQAICIGSGQRLDERGLAVVYVSCGADDNMHMQLK